MRLGAVSPPPSPGLELAAGEVLDRRLRAGHARPVAVALSGGGDSLALLLAAADWAARADRRLIVLTVDHRLRPESAAWTDVCEARAERLGLAFRGLAWAADKPTTGLPAAARAARHALLADAARESGARVILLGHTADDVLEARLMRQAGSTTPEPREWSPSPAWPQGRGLFVLRPLLAVRRAEIRAWLAARGERWIDDPANADAAYARPRARQALAAGATPSAAEPPASAKALARAARPDGEAGFEIDRPALRAAAPEALARFAAAACLCAAGTTRPPDRAKAQRLAARLAGAEAGFAVTLAGARIEADGETVRFRREPGETARGGLAPIRLGAGEIGVWDGRFEVAADGPCDVAAAPRGTTPVALDRSVTLAARSLTHERLLAACGAVEAEPL
ncbi:MAG TPA: tRNA lysidine(34) synthetase TilS [Phenylobacterium sp.]|uniref:tRNA lysidine(34) synthetase TilS n=1 Tax=Phenylobacterium sp. TaxID=1871053 RepID=UPI002D08F112|nr:tRNA lysidine(34) synthetase TilS [Phenylobacterium sp.]HXA38450.1 tRNA lysidine(34) synthetase TilS [Phenylobacterium sp.]